MVLKAQFHGLQKIYPYFQWPPRPRPCPQPLYQILMHTLAIRNQPCTRGMWRQPKGRMVWPTHSHIPCDITKVGTSQAFQKTAPSPPPRGTRYNGTGMCFIDNCMSPPPRGAKGGSNQRRSGRGKTQLVFSVTRFAGHYPSPMPMSWFHQTLLG